MNYKDETPEVEKDPLNIRQRKFVEEYLIDYHATNAYIRAGYRTVANVTARVNASRLLSHPHIKAAVRKAEGELLEQVRIRQHEIFSELRNVALSNIDNYIVDEEGAVTLKEGVDKAALRAISSIHKKTIQRMRGSEVETIHDVKISLWNKVDGLRIAAQTQSMLTDKTEQAGAGGGPIVVKVEYSDKNS